MGKVTIFQCDYCGTEHKSFTDVKILDGVILDGDENVIFESTKDQIICNDCVIKKFEKITEIIEEEKESKEEIEDSKKRFLKKIKNTTDENEFIEFIGYVNRDDFKKVYEESLIDHYYPIDAENEETLDKNNFNKLRNGNVIYQVLASIPQIKKMKVYVNDDNNEFAIANEDLFEE